TFPRALLTRPFLSLNSLRSRLTESFVGSTFLRESIPPPTNFEWTEEERRAERRTRSMKFQANTRGRTFFALLAIAIIAIGQFVWAQNLGSAPASNVAVQGQSGAQPEGAFLNFINWVGNVIAPVGAGG